MSTLRDLLPGVPLVESPLFYALLDDMDLDPSQRQVAIDLHERGYAVLNFPDVALDGRIERIKEYLQSQLDVDMSNPDAVKNSGAVRRVQDAWAYQDDIREIASNRGILELLAKLYGRRPFPFQTLNFPVGTQQRLHSDSIHFSSIPERFMCGVWLAMEDVPTEAGPLTYLPGSHKWPILNNVMIGRQGVDGDRELTQTPFEAAWEALIADSKIPSEVFLARKGQALIWAANLLHGGMPLLNPKLTRWSQVTHYYFDDCIYYTPAFSDEPLGRLELRAVVDVETEQRRHNSLLGKRIENDEPPPNSSSLFRRIKRRIRTPGLPDDFDREAYYRLNPDVAIAKLDAATHYLSHGKAEGRRYRFRPG